MKYIGKASLFLLPILVLLFVSAVEENEEGIVGMWRIHKIEYKNDKTHTWQESEWMKDGNAMLHYDDKGNMSIHFTPNGYEAESMPNPYYLDSLTTQHLRMLSSDYWYVGRYKVDPKAKTVEHLRIMHSDPNEWGKTVRRGYELRGDTLLIFPEEFNLRLSWVRDRSH